MTIRPDEYENAARRHGWRTESDCMPWAEGAGIVHGPTFDGTDNLSDTVYTSWQACCEEMGISVPQQADRRAG
jgi:hypothetical protein